MSQLTLKLFGAPQVYLDDRLLDFDHRKPLALFVYLVLTQQVHTRETLATYFWPESGQALAYLRNNLWLIKRSLGSVHGELLSISHDEVVFRPQMPVQIDVWQFTQRIEACAQESLGDDIQPLIDAVELYGGEFLAGFTLRDSPAFDEWCFFQQQTLRQQVQRALDRIVTHFQDASDFSTAITYAQCRVQIEPTDEAAHRQLMQLYAWNGQAAAALRQAQAVERILHEELAVAPEQATADLITAIKTRRLIPPTSPPSLPASTARSKQPVAPVAKQRTAVHPYAYDLIGREPVLQEIGDLLQQPAVQLLTLSGPGGVGKTSLAYATYLAQTANFVDGCYWVELAAVREPNFVAVAIAQQLDLADVEQEPVNAQLLRYLQPKSALLVLDNFEHVIGAAPLLAELVAHCPQLKLLVTSREVLRLRCEYEFIIPLLSIPEQGAGIPNEEIRRYSAVQLFLKRLTQVQHGYVPDQQNLHAIVTLCRRLDGLPLAIELAAATCKLYSPQALLAQMSGESNSRLSLLHRDRRDGITRHQTLNQTITWSYDLLEPSDQRLLRTLAYVVGSFPLEAIFALCPDLDDGSVRVRGLVDKSLLQLHQQTDGTPRFRMLETVRAFGLTRLHERKEVDAVATCHATYYVAVATTIQPQLRGLDSAQVAQQFRLDYDNVRVAFRWLLTQNRVRECLLLCHVLLDFWILGALHEAAEFVDDTLALATGYPTTSDYANALVSAGFIARAFGDHTAEVGYFVRALAMDAELRRQNLAGGDVVKINTAMGLLAWAAFRRGAHTEALQRYAAAVIHAQEAEHTWSVAMSLMNTGHMQMSLGNYAAAEEALLTALRLHRQVGQGQGYMGVLCHVATLYIETGRLTAAKECLAEALTVAQAMDDQSGIARVYLGLARLAVAQGALAQARRACHQVLHIQRTLRISSTIVPPFLLLMQVELATGAAERVVMLGAVLDTYWQQPKHQASPNEQELWQELYSAACQKLSAAAIQRAQAHGKMRSVAEVVDELLVTDKSPSSV